MDAKGRETEGVIEAENQTRAIAAVREKGMFPTSVVEVGGKQKGARSGGGGGDGGRGGLSAEIRMPKFLTSLFGGRVKASQLTIFTRQFELRMNNGKTYNAALIQDALKDFTTWTKKR